MTEPLSVKARRLRDDYRNGVHELLAPDLFPTEVANALIVARRRGRILPGQELLYLADVMTTLPVIFPTLPALLPRAAAIAAATPASVYDCLYVALAEREGCPFVTADDRLVRNLQAQFPFVLPLAS
ncbi:MAG TPA: type II toxin-antitoxin system VapC family toxin, partial [Gemmataceae bacterium]